MKRYDHYLFITVFLFFSCSDVKQGDLPVIPVDFVNNTVQQLPLSEISDSITAIELELTDESVINPRAIQRIIISDELVFIAQSSNILVFDRNGSFVRSFGSKGQGPGEYTEIQNMTIDEINKRLFVHSNTKIICYDWNGKVLMASSFSQGNSRKRLYDINYINHELLLISWSMGKEDEKGVFSHAEVYCLNDELHITDSCTLLKLYGSTGYSFGSTKDYILISDSTVYLYYPFSTARVPNSTLTGMVPQLKSVIRDTLYRYENNQLVPGIKLKFKNDGIDIDGYMFINLVSVYRSSRYIFAEYFDYSKGRNDNDAYSLHIFCYDTKTGKGYRVVNDSWYTDDINQIERVHIRPFQSNSEIFYYWYTNMKPDDREEPNPTLYIGTLKK